MNSNLVVLLIILVIVIVFGKTVSNFVFNLRNPYYIFNSTNTDLYYCYKKDGNNTYSDLIKAKGGFILLTPDIITSSSNIVFSSSNNSIISTTPYAITTFTDVKSIQYEEPVINYYNSSTFLDMPNIYGSPTGTITGIPKNRITANNNKISKHVMIIEPFNIKDYSTWTHTDVMVGGNDLNYIVLDGDKISRFAIYNEIEETLTNGVPFVTQINDQEFYTNYYLPPNINTDIFNYTIRYIGNDTSSIALSSVEYKSNKVYYGTGDILTSYDTNYSFTPPVITILPASIDGINSNTIAAKKLNMELYSTLPPGTIRYVDTINNFTGISLEVVLYKFSSSLSTIIETSKIFPYYPKQIPYVLYNNISGIIENDENELIGRYIYRYTNTNKKDVYKIAVDPLSQQDFNNLK